VFFVARVCDVQTSLGAWRTQGSCKTEAQERPQALGCAHLSNHSRWPSH